MSEENISQEFSRKNIDESTNYLIAKTNQNELMGKKNKITYFNFYSYWIRFHF